MRVFRLKTVGLVLACHAVTLWPSTVHAQLTAPRETSQIVLGPLSLYPSVQITDAGKDTNIFNAAAQPKEDYTFTVSSMALAVLRLGANELMFQSGGDYVWFREYRAERFASARYAMRLNLSASRLKPFVGGLHNRTRSRPSLEIDARARRLERAVLGGFAVDLTERMSITASMQLDDSVYELNQRFQGVDLSQALNRTGRSFSAGVRYAITPLTTFVVLGDYTEDDFPESHIRDTRMYSIGPGLEFSPDAAIRGRVSAGFQIFQPVDRSLPEKKGGVVSAALNWSLYKRITMDIQGTRNVNYSYLDTQPYYVLTGGRVSLSRPLFGPLSVQGGGEWDHLSYRWRRGVPLDMLLETPLETTPPRGDTVKILFCGFRINLGRGVVATLTAERTRRRSNEDWRQNFERTRLLSSVTIGS
jgi:putative beta-barrel porin BBP2